MSDRPTPETDALDCELHTPRVLQDRYSEMRDHAQKLERERDEAREALKHIGEYGTEEINAAVELRQKLASALVERDEALMDRGNEDIATMTRNHYERILRERDEARAVAGAMADIAFKHLTSLLASTPHSKDAAHDEETQQVIAAIKQWKELKQ